MCNLVYFQYKHAAKKVCFIAMPIKMSDTLQNTILSTVKSLKKSFCIVASCKAGDMFYLVEFGVESLFFYCSLVLGLFSHIWLQDAKRERKKEREKREER